ncbi:hypothetical protein ASPWEDRAFT_741347 [Aspergillus wentii DTO 134E9]|uniref:L-asparaginase II n=1 Tax=Aspergillus wentii DTO 134E9 TaxID=1073089 RepID=A0A1L9RMV9_ASPWE|nr:uncharacterized protein ASPWEDRAFT_741347 [Aspergillus wentii DTO 134E9]KAI9929400.1 hypothetical protein MW887_000870 [Aspergillus wentii]OJJ36158.1 hypothetical protein ASPWEDRAFT_741347 [Aspergillus wentii DTO 134E9]
MAPTNHITVYRGRVVENRHAVHAAIVDSTGKLLYAVGDPSRITLPRSSTKPAQAVAVLETGAFDIFPFDDEDLALSCSSHSSEERHIARVNSMLAKVQANEADLRCGGQSSISEQVNQSWLKRDFVPTAACSNCSGKHVGMLAGAKALGTEISDYHLPTHPMQQRVMQVVEELSGAEKNKCEWAVDGCNLPTPAFPLRCFARIYAGFAAAADEDAADTATNVSRTKAMARIFHSMNQYPELVGGKGRFCTLTMKNFQGALVCKPGSQGCCGIGIRASEKTRQLGADGAMGISVKIEDGNIDILYSAVVEILKQLDIGTLDSEALSAFHHPKILSTTGAVIGHVSHMFQIRRCI